MPARHPIPPVLAGRHRSLISHFLKDYSWAVEQEKQLPKKQRFVTNIGPSYAAIGWLLRRDRKYRLPATPKGRFLHSAS